MAFLDFNISGDTPELIFGEITNIEDDVIELTRYPDFMKLYIDFENKGIPKYLPIIDIKIRDKPSVLTTESEDIHNFFLSPYYKMSQLLVRLLALCPAPTLRRYPQ